MCGCRSAPIALELFGDQEATAEQDVAAEGPSNGVVNQVNEVRYRIGFSQGLRQHHGLAQARHPMPVSHTFEQEASIDLVWCTNVPAMHDQERGGCALL